MPRSFDKGLYIVFPRNLRQFAQRAQLGKLRFVIRIRARAWTQAIAQREGHIVGFHDVANILKMRVEEIFLMMRNAPFGQNRAAARDNAGATIDRHRDEWQTQTRMNGEVVHALLRLLNQGVAEDFPSQILGNTADFFQCLVNRYGANRHGAVANDPVARGVDILPR